MKLYKYRNFGEFTNQIITNSELYFSPINQFNDPFDCKLTYRQNYSDDEIIKNLMDNEDKEDFVARRNRTTNKMIEKIGILSLSSKYNSILMWSHYAEDHTGLVLEFDISLDKDCFIRPLRIDYHTNYEELSYTNKQEEELPKLMLTKYKDWIYEDEYRVIDLYYNGVKKFKKESLRTIIFGAKANNHDMKCFMILCQDNGFSHVTFKQAKICTGKFELEIEDIDE